MQTVYFKVLCIWLLLHDLMSNYITLVLLLEFHSVPFIVSLGTPVVTIRPDGCKLSVRYSCAGR